MNNNNIVKIGTALKWRNTYDESKRYYQENIVTICGCVFRCKVLQATGKTPVAIDEATGHMVYVNEDVWDVVVDMAYYYNFAVDTNNLTRETLDYVRRLDEAYQSQQKEIKAIQDDDKNQWSHINEIERLNTEQQREIDSMLDTISCFSEGIWIDSLMWSNETLWDNNKYAITDSLQQQVNTLAETHETDIENINSHIQQHEETQMRNELSFREQLQTIASGCKTYISLSQTTVYKNVETSITVNASTDISGTISFLQIYCSGKLVGTTAEKSLSKQYAANASDDLVFTAKTAYKDIVLQAEATLYARHPIYCGFASAASGVKDDAHRLSARTSAAGTYKANSPSNGQRYYILVPSDIPSLTSFTMGGAPYVMNSSKVTYDGWNTRCTSLVRPTTQEQKST